MKKTSPSSTSNSAEELILRNTNELLRSVGVASKKISHFSELQKSASSMFVAIFEAMFQVRLKGVIRKPSHVKDYEHNAQAVITALGNSILSMDLSHISGASIVNGDSHAIMNLVDIFVGISEVWLKRRFQNDALGRTRKALKPSMLKGKVPALNLEKGPKGGQQPKVRPQTAKRPKSAREPKRGSNEIHESLANMASEYPAMWRSLSERGVARKGDDDEGEGEGEGEENSPPTRLQRLEKRHLEDREARQKSEYKRLLKDRLVALRRKDILESKKQNFRQRGVHHNEKVRGIKVKLQQEKMRRQQLSFRLRRKTQAETRMRKLYLSMIKSLHDTKREAEHFDAQKLVSLKHEGGARAQALDAFFAERIEMVNAHIGVQENERAAQTQAQEAQIRQLLRELSADSKVRVEQKMQRAAELEDQELRRGAEATLALAQVIGVEDWNAVYKDRFMTPMVSDINKIGKEIQEGGEMGSREETPRSVNSATERKKRQIRKRQLKSAYGVGE